MNCIIRKYLDGKFLLVPFLQKADDLFVVIVILSNFKSCFTILLSFKNSIRSPDSIGFRNRDDYIISDALIGTLREKYLK